jgi:glycosyltransferase involved in cell wall biosynthesis
LDHAGRLIKRNSRIDVENMRSLFIVSLDKAYGGAERNIETLAEALQQHLKVTVFACSPTHIAVLQKLLRPPSRVIGLRQRRGTIDRIAWVSELSARFMAFRPDAILTNTNISAQIVATVAGIVPGVSRRTFIYVGDFTWKDFDRIFKRLDTARVLIPGPALLDRPDYLVSHLAPVGPMQWSIVANAVRLPGELEDSDAPEGYVLHLATARLWKGHYELIRAAAMLRDRGLPVQFVSRGAVAKPALWQALQHIVSRWKLTQLFTLQDATDDPSTLIHRCLCVVVPSISHFGGPEPFGRTIVEAWAHAKPVVAFDTGGPHYLIEHQQDGLLVPEGNVAMLADASQELRQDPDLCRRLGENGLAKIRRLYSAATIARELATILLQGEA